MKHWIMAARPKTLTAGIIPIIVATALAFNALGHVDWILFASALLASICIQIGTNFINDALDFKKGADTTERLGPPRVTQSGLLNGETVYRAGLGLLLFSFIIASPLMFKGGLWMVLLLLVSLLCGYLYTGGPKPLAYTGLGDVFVFLFYGLVAVLAVFYIQTGFLNLASLLAAVQIGMFATIIIAINNLRDHVGDAKAGKKTLAVRFGPTFAFKEIVFLSISPFCLNLLWWQLGYTWIALSTLLLLPLALFIVQKIGNTTPGKAYNQYFGYAALLHLSFGIMLAILLGIK